MEAALRIMFDEYHSESWTISAARAHEMQPDDPCNSSYQTAADALRAKGFMVVRNTDSLLTTELLNTIHVLVIVHPCHPLWEKTTSTNDPKFSDEEIVAIQDFVGSGGGLIVLSEYENEKYGNNLNTLIEHFGIQIENTTVSNRTRCLHHNPTWVIADISDADATGGLLTNIKQACFYRSASCTVAGAASIAVQLPNEARPKNAGLVAVSRYGSGRVAVITDTDLFGDEFVADFDHMQLWLNLVYWVAVPGFQATSGHRKTRGQESLNQACIKSSAAWLSLKARVNELRRLQQSDGSIGDAAWHGAAQQLVFQIIDAIKVVAALVPHQADYLEQVQHDFGAWVEAGLHKPDFGRSLALFNPQLMREDGLEHVVIFPLYTPNASLDTRFEALIVRVSWPAWLATLESNTYQNDEFVPSHLVDFTDGYDSECAVLFPETVSVTGPSTNNFGIIFCDREGQRYSRYVAKACELTNLSLPPQLECFLGSPDLIQNTFALWDLIHDKAHSMGELPFDPFMIRKKCPYWMYALEELRVDLVSFCDAVQIARVLPIAAYVCYAVLFDRIFRFATAGSRVRNYDALAGQILFCFLRKRGVLVWQSNTFGVRWSELPAAVAELRDELNAVYREGVNISRLAFWIAAHDFVAQYVKPNLGSQWQSARRAIDDETDPKKWIALVHDDEFPLGNFHTVLRQKMRKL